MGANEKAGVAPALAAEAEAEDAKLNPVAGAGAEEDAAAAPALEADTAAAVAGVLGGLNAKAPSAGAPEEAEESPETALVEVAGAEAGVVPAPDAGVKAKLKPPAEAWAPGAAPVAAAAGVLSVNGFPEEASAVPVVPVVPAVEGAEAGADAVAAAVAGAVAVAVAA